ncbi:hypothetical protein N7499_012825 [Penicillium canescens]|uniref:t-SNARE coiled-coil homology domain-containing protein n=1 Tax=Penicillium canescens TaxID=5083 RepID=A0AAD6I488_PENCN|nr:uncharacterized protein N7446_000528 [Penicillium canescens]KAJ6030409.1 hypothetical protein N7460_010675 [Penicillium canescens]KAJ6060783.1 hypothetical protein N7444_002637 [Penicillium canescens]KAJ6064145.1 hypothetical protein N7499_012825 [Penicillium canescens]KAJ6077592.1 hypothetical protein N7446_000528 [Penicillium canescens]KAJ6154360.1 hypothetical protein N7485_012729 [Penicillium canescens]
MTDLTPTLNSLLSKHGTSTCAKPTTKTADEFLKEAYRINYHITSLLHYLQTIRHAYLSTTPQRRNANAPTSQPTNPTLPSTSQTLTDPERDTIDTQTSLLLRDLATSLTNLSSAETLRQETEQTLLRKKYGHSAASALLFRWAGGKGVTDDTGNEGKSAEQVTAEERARALKTVREGVLWFLRRGLEVVVGVQRGLVEKRIERVREKEKSVLYKVAAGRDVGGSANAGGKDAGRRGSEKTGGYGSGTSFDPSFSAPDASTLSEADTARIEAQLSPEQLQLFAEENDTMLRHYEDTLGKVQNAEKSLLEISSLQETLVTHLATQEEYITQLVSDVDTTQTNVGQGNRELKRATERRSTAQAVFWGTVGLCTWLVVWDLVF